MARDLVRLVDAQAAQRDRVRESVLASARKAFRGWRDFYTPRQVARFIDALVRIIEPGQQRTASTTDAYLARVLADMRGRPVAPVGVRVDPAKLRGGTDHRDVLERVAAEYRRRVAEGLNDAAARQRAERRLEVIVTDDLALAEREATRQVYTKTPGVTGYRRVIHPERSRGGTCGLCAVASDQIYRTGTLLPLHGGCQCTTLPIIGAKDPGRSLNRDELDALYEQAGGTSMEKLKRTRVVVHEHGELGPVLRESGQHFKGPEEVAA